MSRVSDLACNETMSAVDDIEKKEGRRFFQQPVGMPIARIAPVTPNVPPLQNPRQYVKTYIRSQVPTQIQVGCSSGTHKMMHAQGATTISSTQGIGPLCGRSKVVAIRPAATTHAFIKPYDVAQLSSNPVATVYLQHQQNLHAVSAQQPVVSLSPSRVRECEEQRLVRTASATFTNGGNLESRRYLTPARSIVGVGDMSIRGSVRVNPGCSGPTTIPSRNGCKLASKDLIRGTKSAGRICNEKGDVKPIIMPLPTVNVTSSAVATSINVLPGTCISLSAGQHDGIPSPSHPGPSPRPTILRKNREPGSGSAVRRLFVAETHPQSSPYREVLTSPVTATKDEAGLFCLKRANAGENRTQSTVAFMPSDVRAAGIFARKAPTVMIGSAVPATKNYSDQVGVVGAAEISPRKRLRKQNFEGANSEKMKLLISTDRVVGDSVVSMKDGITWKPASNDDTGRPVNDAAPEKISKKRGRARLDNGAVAMSAKQHASSIGPKVKRVRETQPVASQGKYTTSGVPVVVEQDSRTLLGRNLVDGQQSSLQSRQPVGAVGESVEVPSTEKFLNAQMIDDATSLMCRIFGLEPPVPDDPCPKSDRNIDSRSLCDLPTTFCFFGGESDGNCILNSSSTKSVAQAAGNRQKMVERQSEELIVAVGSTIESSGTSGDLSSTAGDHGNESDFRQMVEQARKTCTRLIRSFGLKDRSQRLNRLSNCERVLRRMYMKQWMVQKHGRVATNLAADVELDSNLIVTLEDYSLAAARKQTEKFLESFPSCSASTSDEMYEKHMSNGAAQPYSYIEEAMEVPSGIACSVLPGISLASSRRTAQTSGRFSRDLQTGSCATRRDPETEMLQAVAEVLAEIIEVVVNSDIAEQRNCGISEQLQVGRKRKKKDVKWLEVEIIDRFGTATLPRSPSQVFASLHDDICWYAPRRKRKLVACDSDDVFWMNIENELRSKRKRSGNDKRISRTLHAFRQVRTVSDRLTDMRKVEYDNLEEATKLLQDHVRCTDSEAYSEFMNAFEEDCQPNDSEKVCQEKWQKRLLSFCKAVPQVITPVPNGYDPNAALRIRPTMSEVLKLFKGKWCRPPKRLRPGTKRTRKNHSRRSRGRQRNSVVRPKKMPSTPEPQLEDLQPHFTAAEMSAIFKKEFEVDLKAFRCEKRMREDASSGSEYQMHAVGCSEERVAEPVAPVTDTSVQDPSCSRRNMIIQDIEPMDLQDDIVMDREVRISISEEPEIMADGKGAGQERDSSGSNIGSSETVPYIVNDGFAKHIRQRGRYIREHFATLLHALRINEMLTVKAIKMFKDFTVELFDRETKSVHSS